MSDQASIPKSRRFVIVDAGGNKVEIDLSSGEIQSIAQTAQNALNKAEEAQTSSAEALTAAQEAQTTANSAQQAAQQAQQTANSAQQAVNDLLQPFEGEVFEG